MTKEEMQQFPKHLSEEEVKQQKEYPTIPFFIHNIVMSCLLDKIWAPAFIGLDARELYREDRDYEYNISLNMSAEITEMMLDIVTASPEKTWDSSKISAFLYESAIQAQCKGMGILDFLEDYHKHLTDRPVSEKYNIPTFLQNAYKKWRFEIDKPQAPHPFATARTREEIEREDYGYEDFEDMEETQIISEKGGYSDPFYPGDIDTFDMYYKEVGKVYNRIDSKHRSNPHLSRDETINYHLKMVVPIARRYLGLGLTLPELVSAGNLGLCMAYDKFKEKSQSPLKDLFMDRIRGFPEDEVPKEEVERGLLALFEYGFLRKNLLKLINKSPSKDTIPRSKLLEWTEKYIKPAKFSSVCGIYIKAYIIEELNNYSRMVRVPKLELNKYKKTNGVYPTQTVLSLDKPSFDEEETEEPNNIIDKNKTEDTESYTTDYTINRRSNHTEYQILFNKLCKGLNSNQIQMLKDYYGIGIPRRFTIKEISEIYSVPVGTIHNHIKKSINIMKNNSLEHDISFNQLSQLLNDEE